MERKIEYVAKTTLLKRGWTEKGIKELLPEPKLVYNSYYRKAAKMKLWDIKVIKQKERTKKFKEYAESKEKRSKKMKEVAERKKNETLKQIEEFDFQVERLEIEELKRKALEAKLDWYNYTGQYERADNVFNVDKDTIKRWEINYIRHNLTNYDEELKKLYRKIGKVQAYINYKEILMERIFEVYPELK